MKNTKLTISELENLTGITRRTIHFYTKRKLIPPPNKPGGGARYGEESYLRLLLIKELQKSHLKLSGIKEALDAMTIKEMRDFVNKVKGEKPAWDKEALENWSQGFSTTERIVRDATPVVDVQRSLNDSFSFLKIGSDQEKVRKRREVKTSYLKDLKRNKKIKLSETTWKRVKITDGIEFNIRSDIQNKYASIISKWIQYLEKNILKGDS